MERDTVPGYAGASPARLTSSDDAQRVFDYLKRLKCHPNIIGQRVIFQATGGAWISTTLDAMLDVMEQGYFKIDQRKAAGDTRWHVISFDEAASLSADTLAGASAPTPTLKIEETR